MDLIIARQMVRTTTIHVSNFSLFYKSTDLYVVQISHYSEFRDPLMSFSTCHFPLQQAIHSDDMNLSKGKWMAETVEGVAGG